MTASGSLLRQRVRDGELLIGTFLNMGTPVAAEVCGLAGLDWVLIDLEHGTGHESELLGQLLGARAGGVPALVRVENDSRQRIGRALDLGAAGVMIPRIESAEEAARASSHLRYGSGGDRGVATYNRACGFGTRVEAISTADGELLGVIQIESPDAVIAAAEIAALDGVDVLFIGPGDLSHAMGCFGRTDAPEFVAACRAVVNDAATAGVAAGVLVPGPSRVEWAAELGFRFIGVGSDSTLLLAAAQAASRSGLVTDG